jgi:hypothetical protein
MADAFLERRREPRVPMPPDQRIGLPLSVTVRLVDISNSGVLLSSAQKVAVGQRARLQTKLGQDPFSVDVEVRRVTELGAAPGDRGRFKIGAVFTGVDEVANRSMQRFLNGELV